MEYSSILSQQFNIKEEYAQNIITLLDDGNTIPFIARYRKEMHGSMDLKRARGYLPSVQAQEKDQGFCCKAART